MSLPSLWKQLFSLDAGSVVLTPESRAQLEPTLRRLVRRALRVPADNRAVTGYIHDVAARCLEQAGWDATDLADRVCDAVWCDLGTLAAASRPARRLPVPTLVAGTHPTIRASGV